MVAGRTWGTRLSMDPAEENGTWVDQCLVLVPPPPPDKYHLLLQKRRRRRSVRMESLRGE